MTRIILRTLSFVFMTAIALSETGHAAGTTYQVTAGDAQFKAVGKPGFLRINGEGGKPTGTLSNDGKNTTGEFRCDIEPFHTGIDLRDKHMKEKYLETGKYPQALLSLKEYALGAGERPFKAALTLHGVTRDIEGTAEAKSHDNRWTIGADFKINLKDFTIDIPSFAGVTVAELVNVHVTFDAEEQKR